MTQNYIWWRRSSSGFFGNVEYPFITIKLRSILVFVKSPMYARVWLMAFFYYGYQARRFQKWLELRWHSSKKGCLRCLGINLAPLEKFRVWDKAPLGSRIPVSAAIHECLTFPSTRVRQPQPTATKPKHIRPDNKDSKNGTWCYLA